MTAWAVTSGKMKRIHRADCRHGKHPYNWAGDRTEAELLAALIESGAFRWHDACQLCSYDLDQGLYEARCAVGLETPFEAKR